MSELRDALHNRAATLAASLRDAPQFDAPVAKVAIRRKHRNRSIVTATGATMGAVVIGVGAWIGYGVLQPAPVTSSTPTPTASAEPSRTPSATPSATPAPTYEGRNPSMSDEEALARAASPATGEVWLDEPQEVEPGAWSDDEFFSGYWDAPTWYLVGHRGDSQILSMGRSGYLVEVAENGEPALVIAPRPDQDPVTVDVSGVPIAVATDVYYDSLALPATVATPEGTVLDLRADVSRLMEQPLHEVSTIGPVAGSRLVRDTAEPYTEAWGSDVDDLLGGKVRSVTYFIETPYGALLQPPLNPLSSGVQWNQGNGDMGDAGFVDFFDQTCENSLMYATALDPETGGEWVEAGTVGDRPVLVPASSNTLGNAMYATWRQWAADFGDGMRVSDTITSLEEYLSAPAFVAVPTDDPDTWWLLLNQELSARAWC